MTTPIFHPLLRMIAEKAPAKKFNAKSKSGDFFHFLDQSTSIWSKDSINKFLVPYCDLVKDIGYCSYYKKK